MIVAAIFGICTLAAVVIATGFGYHDPSDVKLDERWAREAAGPEDNDEERTSISLGWLVHGLLSMKARIIRLVTRRSALHAPKPIRRAPTPAVSQRDRFEPRVDAAHDDEPEIEEDDEIDGRAARAQARGAQTGQALRRLPASRAVAAGAAQIHRQIRAEPGLDPGDAQHRSKACWTISACAARSSTSAPARWSRSTSSSPRRASSRRA